MAKTTSAAIQKVVLRLPEEVADHYSERAMKRGRQLETELMDQLSTTRTYASTSPIYITDEGRSALSVLAGRALTTEASIISWAQNVSSIKVGGVEVPLSEQLLKRLSTRTFGQSFEDYVRKAVIEQLEALVGLR